MKNLMRKVILILFLLLMIVNNSLLVTISEAVDEIQSFTDKPDETKIDAIMEINLEKYVNYTLSDEIKGVMVQANLKTGTKYEDGQDYKPLLSTSVELNLPKINDEYPQEVKIIGISTKSTNGSDTAKDFEYEYDKNSGILKMVTVNKEDENGNIYGDNIENSRDEFTLVSYYSKNCYNNKNDEKDLKFTGIVQVDLKNDEELNITKDIEQSYKVNKNISNLISTKIDTSEVYDGFINSNKLKNTQYRTEYVQNMGLDIGYIGLADEINLNINNSFLKNDKVVNNNEIVYKSTKINKQEILDKLGEDGYLKILNLDGKVLGEINKDTETLENEFVEFNYEGDISNLIIILSKPINLGILNIQNIMQIKDTMKDIENNKILTKCNIQAIDNIKNADKEKETVVNNKEPKYTFLSDNVIEIKKSETRIDLSIDKSDLTNNIQNDVIFKAYLFENDSRYSLFDNPVIDIELPTEVDNVILGDISLLYGNGLKFSNAEVIDNGNNKIIRLSLLGNSSDYVLNSMVNGPELLIPATIIIKKDVLSTDSSIKYTYKNNVNVENDYINQEKQYKDIGIHIDSIVQDVKNEDTNNLSSAVEKDNKEEFITEIVAKVGNTVLKENDIVYQGEAINYTVKFKNNSSQSIYNLNTICSIPEGTTFVIRNSLYSDVPIEGEEGNEINDIWDKKAEIREHNIFLEELKPGDSFEQSYLVLVEEIVEQKELISNFKTSIQGNVVKEESFKVVANSAELCANLYPQDPERGVYKNNDTHQLKIVNLSDKDIENVVVDVYVSREITVNLDGLMGKFDECLYDENNGILRLKYNRIEVGETKNILVNTIVDKFENGVYSYNPILYAKVYTNKEIQYRSALNSMQIVRPKISIIQTSEKESKELATDEEIEYNFVVKNESDVATYINIEDNLPDEIVPIETEYEYFELDSENDQWNKKVKIEDISEEVIIDGVVQSDFNIETYIPENETLNIKIKAKADGIFKSVDTINVATVSGDDIFTITSNGIKNTVLYFGYGDEDEEPDKPVDPEEPDKPDNPDNPDNPSIEENRYSINGVVWLDSDKDGRRTSNEKLLSNIEVKLFDMKTNKIVVDNNNNSMSTSTNDSGYYSFNGIRQGKYIVLFKFDTDKYSLTTYQKNAISESVNSDVILKEVNINGNTYKAGVTDTIDLVKNYSNIDMGLVENNEFDLRLDKYISNITVNYNGQGKSYDYNNTKLAKVEIPSKQLANSLINVEYKIVVTNEGNTAGYVKEITDYIPSGLSFNAIYNEGWKKDTSGNLVNDSLSGSKIEPGESIEVVLILTAKNITKSIVNAAEISKTYNVNELKDIDSTEANRDIKEDDYSTAEMIISIKTGILFSIFKIILMIALVVGFAFAIYYFRNSNARKIFLMSILLIGIIASGFTSIARANKVIYWRELGHHLKNGVWEPVNRGGTYWCISESKHLCNKPHLYYLNDEYDCWSIGQVPHGIGLSYLRTVFPGFDFGTSGNTKKSINMKKTKSPSELKRDDVDGNGNILVGPFKFSADVDDKYISSYVVYSQKGDITSKTLVCDKNGNSKKIAKSQAFYLAVPSDTKKVKLVIKMEYEYKSEKKGLHFKTWYFDQNAGGNYCQGGANDDAQSLLEISPKTKSEKNSVKDKLTWMVSSTPGGGGDDEDDGDGDEDDDPIHTPADGEYSIKITKTDDESNVLEDVGFKFTAAIQLYDVATSENQNVECVHNLSWHIDENGQLQIEGGMGYLEYDSNGNIIGCKAHANDTKSVNKYTSATYDYYLDSSGNWVKGSAENAYVHKTNSNGVINLSGAMPKATQTNINTNGDSKDVVGTFVGGIKAIEVENPNYGQKAQEEKEFGLVSGTSKTIENPPALRNLNINKVDSEDKNYDLSGVEFKIAITEGDDKKYLQLTDASGHVYSGEDVGSNVTIHRANKANGSDYHVEYVSNAEQASIFTTSKNGKISVENVEKYYEKDKEYKYTFEEINNKNYGYKQEVGNTYEATMNGDNGYDSLENTHKVRNLNIRKRDKRVWDMYREEVGLEDVEFKIRISEPGYLQLSDSKGVVKSVKGTAVIDEHNENAGNGKYIVKYVSSKEEATTFITDENGIIRIENLEMWKNPDEKYTYYMDETAMGEKWELYYDVKTEDEAKDDNTTLDDYGETEKPIYNYQRYVDLAGYVWEDIGTGKIKQSDSYFIESEEEKKIPKDLLQDGSYKGVTVKLIRNGNVLAISETGTGKDQGAYFFPSQMKTTDSKYPEIKSVQLGGYKIEIDYLKEYSIEFWYNGLKYASVEFPEDTSTYWQKDNSSKAKDNDKNRKEIDDKFYAIKGGNDRTDKTIGYTNSGNKEVELTYKNEKNSSTLVDNTQYTRESLSGSVSNIDAATIMASTRDSNYEITFVPERTRVRTTIENLNLGIKRRPQADLAITTDLDNVKMMINGYSHTYNYQKRPNLGYDKVEEDDGYDAAMDVFSVKAGSRYSDEYRKLSYVREIYPSYIAHASDNNVNQEDKLQILVTYKIVIKNESSLTNTVKLRNYYDTDQEDIYEKLDSVKVANKDIDVNEWKLLKWRETASGESVKMYEMNGENITVEGYSLVNVLLTYRVRLDSIIKLMSKNELKTHKNTTEIISYSTYDGEVNDDNKYASIDNDSAPDNTVYGKDDTYEDDIDSAPDFVISKSKEEKTLTGTVFEDKAGELRGQINPNTSISTHEFLGNGIKDAEEKLVNNARVQLLDKKGNSVDLYRIDSGGSLDKKVADKLSGISEAGYDVGNGQYKFVGLVPGIYYLKYTYGTGYKDNSNNSVKTLIVNGNQDITPQDITPQDYKSTIVAYDDVRTNIEGQTINKDSAYKETNEDVYWIYPDDEDIRDLNNGVGYWYEDKNYENHSVSVDNYIHRRNINRYLENFGFGKKTNYDSRQPSAQIPQDYYYMTSQTPIMCVAVEDKDTNNSVTRLNNPSTNEYDANADSNTNERLPNSYETKFGIVERPNQKFEVTKEVSYVKVTLANGQILLEGDPRSNQSISNYLTYPEHGSVKIEIDSEIIQGAKLEIRYEIKVKNLSHRNYDNVTYYNFATDYNNIVKTTIGLIDYLDREVAYFNDGKWTVVDTDNVKDLDLSDDTKRLNKYNFITQNDRFELEPGNIKDVYITATKDLSTAKDMTYDNKVEFYNVENPVGRFYYDTPGNYGDDGRIEDPEMDENREQRRAILIIVPPTGQTRIYYAIGISCLVLLVGGIVLIKKKVLDK